MRDPTLIVPSEASLVFRHLGNLRNASAVICVVHGIECHEAGFRRLPSPRRTVDVAASVSVTSVRQPQQK